VHDSNEILGESKWDILDRVSENVIHNMGESVYQIIAAMDQGLLLIL
jgi:hypothetical protein